LLEYSFIQKNVLSLQHSKLLIVYMEIFISTEKSLQQIRDRQNCLKFYTPTEESTNYAPIFSAEAISISEVSITHTHTHTHTHTLHAIYSIYIQNIK
jgi:hypothetical protein